MIHNNSNRSLSGKGALFVLLALALAGLAYFAVQSDPEPKTPGIDSLPHTVAPDTSEEPDPLVELANLEAQEPPVRSTGQAAANKEARPSLDPTRRIQGKVVFDSPLPADADPEVVVAVRYELKENFIHWDSSHHEIARSKIAADGTFDLPMAASKEDAVTWVSLYADGDYAYGGYLYFELGGEDDPGEEPVTLECRIGSHVTYELRFPSDANPEDKSKVVGREMVFSEMLPASTGQPRTVTAKVTDTGEIVLRHISPFYWTYSTGSEAHMPEANLHPFALPAPLDLEVAGGQRLRIPLELEWAPKISGSVVDENGSPLPEVEVLAKYFHQSRRQYFRYTTQEDGTFSFYGLPTKGVTLEAQLVGRKPVQIAAERLSAMRNRGEEITLVLAPGHLLYGQVVIPTGTPLEQVVVRYEFSAEGSSGSGSVKLDADSDGQFEMPATFGAQYTFTAKVSDGNHRSPASMIATASCTADETSPESPLQLVLTPTPTIRGRVENGNATSFVDCMVFYGTPRNSLGLGGAHMPPGMRGLKEAKVDPSDGSFVLQGLTPGKITLFAQTGRRPKARTSEELVLEIQGEMDGIILSIPPITALAGFVFDGSGAGVPEATVTVSVKQGFWSVQGTEKTDDSGHFSIEVSQPGTYMARAEAQGMVCKEPLNFELAAGEAKGDLEIRMAKGAFLRVTVLGLDSKPVPKVSPRLFDSMGHMMNVPHGQVTDDQGFIELGPLIPGKARVLAALRTDSQDSRYRVSQLVQLDPGKRLEVTLDASKTALFSLSGTVTAGNQPMKGYGVQLLDGRAIVAHAVTDEHGAFLFALHEEGSFKLMVSDPNRNRLTIQQDLEITKKSPTLHIELPTGSISGVLKQPNSNMSMSTQIYAIAEGEDLKNSAPASSADVSTGEPFQILHLPDGTYTLIIRKVFPGPEGGFLSEPVKVTVSGGRTTKDVTVKLVDAD